MKKIDIKKHLFIFGLFLMVVMLSCNEEETIGDFTIEVAAASYHDVLFTKISENEVRADVYVRMGITYSNVNEYTNLGVYKILLDENGNEISKTVHTDQISPDTYTRVIIESADDLFNGLTITQNQWQNNYSFRLQAFGSNSGGEEELFESTYEFTPDFNVLEYSVDYNEASLGHVDYVRTSDTKVDGIVDIDLRFTVSADADDAKEFTNIGLIKHLYTGEGTEIDTAIVLQEIELGTETQLTITDLDELYSGIEYDKNTNLHEAMTFSFTLFAETKYGEEVVMDDVFVTTATYSEKILPVLATGVWIAKNEDTGFTKEIEILWDEEAQLYGFTDFGMDWSSWNDMWFGGQFTLKLPEADDDPIYIELTGEGVWETGYFPDMLGDDGVTMENRQVRYMPYRYQDGSPMGYYDANTGNLVFDGVSITDAWWDLDKHENLHLTFSKKQ